MSLNATVARVTERIVDRSAPLRRPYLDRMAQARDEGPSRAHLTCGNQAHAYAAMPDGRQGGAGARERRQPRDRHRLQRHALGAPAVRDLSRR